MPGWKEEYQGRCIGLVESDSKTSYLLAEDRREMVRWLKELTKIKNLQRTRNLESFSKNNDATSPTGSQSISPRSGWVAPSRPSLPSSTTPTSTSPPSQTLPATRTPSPPPTLGNRGRLGSIGAGESLPGTRSRAGSSSTEDAPQFGRARAETASNTGEGGTGGALSSVPAASSASSEVTSGPAFGRARAGSGTSVAEGGDATRASGNLLRSQIYIIILIECGCCSTWAL